MSPKEISKEELLRLYEVKTFILNHLEKKFTVASLARRAAMNEKKFNDSFYFLFGYRVGPYIYEARMRFGYFLLLHSDKRVKEIAFLTGFRHSRNFSKAFQKYFNFSASTVRRRS